MQTVSSKVYTQVAVTISRDDNCYMTSASYYIYMYIYIIIVGRVLPRKAVETELYCSEDRLHDWYKVTLYMHMFNTGLLA